MLASRRRRQYVNLQKVAAMARSKSKSHKRKSRLKAGRPVFYEAIPQALAGPPVLLPPNAAEQLQAGAEAAAAYGHDLLQRSLRLTRAAGHAASQVAQRVARAARESYLAARPHALVLTHAGMGAVRTAAPYGRAFGQDAWHDVIRFRRALTTRRARAFYLAMIAVATIGTVAAGSALAAATMATYQKDLASPAALLDKKKTGITILDRTGKVLYEGYGAQNPTPLKLSDIPQSLRRATLAAEDPEFYSHSGFSWRGTARAAWVDVIHGGKVEGGSTLTQQLVKNTLLSSDKSFERKYKEILLAVALENRYSKDQILEMYLNEIDYGQSSSGVEAAAQTYFHKSARELNLAESATLAGIPLGTTRFDPNVDPKAATERRNYILNRMASLGLASRADVAVAIKQPLKAFAKQPVVQAPHFVFYVLDQLRAKYGADAVEQGGYTVKTTLDLTQQNAAQAIVAAQINKLASNHVTNGGLVSLDPGSGDILTMVGSVGYDTPGFGAVNVTTSLLQPGSSFKPIAYVTAFAKGWTGSTQVDDAPLSLPQLDGTTYVPQNYDQKFRGQVTLRRALSNSLNIPALKVMQFTGMNATIDTAEAMGLTTLTDRSRYGLSLVLGGGEVKPLDMATVYATFANGGVHVPPRAVLSVQDRYGKDITKPAAEAKKAVIDPRYAAMITSILSDNSARSEEFGPHSPLLLDRPAAAKTGTTNDFRDNWTVGYTPNLVTAVWVGNNDHTPMEGVDGITGAAPIWHNYMETALSGVPIEQFNLPSGDTTVKVCKYDGGLANPWDTDTYDEVFLTDQVPTRHCNNAAGLGNYLKSLLPPPPPADGQPPADSPIPDPAAANPNQPFINPIFKRFKPGN